MIAIEDSENQNREAAGRVMPLHMGPGFDWMEWWIFFIGFISTWNLGYESLTTD